MPEKDYSKFVTDYFNVILDISDMENSQFKFNFFHYLREYFALPNPRNVVYDTESKLNLLAFKIEPNRLIDLKILLSGGQLNWTVTEENGRCIFIFS